MEIYSIRMQNVLHRSLQHIYLDKRGRSSHYLHICITVLHFQQEIPIKSSLTCYNSPPSYFSIFPSTHLAIPFQKKISCSNIITFVSYKCSALADTSQAELGESETVASKFKMSSIHLSVTLVE